ncbi:hypothetical protein Ae201684P_002345 [Aphanomyces euteiches]|uniref:Uncharacterized protein n=1 Tax=Aphanomyces euteiches TaxID=100861 RepID=A0A6G0X1R5_9STRA|nr:hypothetical protein Ae201684_009306 [Aphanomyces euteiches]KAH9069972.1 hypothetical protein Ae201684P_002345 [Aphanomyces euteiches]KAH9153780.1 hypothetical protein AeRB84_004022 [Aphanomyces euteiches]
MADVDACCLGLECGALCACCCAAEAAAQAEQDRRQAYVVQPVAVVASPVQQNQYVAGQYIQSPSRVVRFVPVASPTYQTTYVVAQPVTARPGRQNDS